MCYYLILPLLSYRQQHIFHNLTDWVSQKKHVSGMAVLFGILTKQSLVQTLTWYMSNITVNILTNTHTHTSGLTWVRSSDRQKNNLRMQSNNGHRKQRPVELTWAGCPSFLKGTNWVYSGCYETIVPDRSAEKSIIPQDGKIPLTHALYVKTGGGGFGVFGEFRGD